MFLFATKMNKDNSRLMFFGTMFFGVRLYRTWLREAVLVTCAGARWRIVVARRPATRARGLRPCRQKLIKTIFGCVFSACRESATCVLNHPTLISMEKPNHWQTAGLWSIHRILLRERSRSRFKPRPGHVDREGYSYAAKRRRTR